MPRIARKDLETSFFHVMIQGVNREYIFDKMEYIEKYISLLNRYKDEFSITILAYCIMNNHAHIVIYTEDIAKMSKYMHKVNGLYAQYYNKKEERVGIVFRNRFESEPICNERYLIQCIKYVHMNPVNANIVQNPAQYQYSTYNDYISNTGVAKSQILMEIFGKNISELFEEIKENRMFIDIDIKTEEVLENGIMEFENINGKKLEEIQQSRKDLKSLIRFLKVNYRIKYIDMMKRFELTRGEIDSLKEKRF